MKSITRYIALISIIFIASCSKSYLEVQPTDVLTNANFFKTENDAQAALIGVYAQLQPEATYGNLIDAANMDWTMSGDMYEQDQNTPRVQLEMLSLPADNTYTTQLYAGLYEGISRANVVIDRVGAMDNLTASAKDMILAQAKFLRAIYYYKLANYFGGVSLVTSELNASSKLDIPRSPVAEVWKQIETDLTDAIQVLPASWTGANLGRATKGAALAFLVKTYLWQNKYAEAVTASEQIIALNVYGLEDDFRSVFKENNEHNKEIVFATQYSSVNNGSDGSGLDVRSAPRGAPSQYIGRGANSNFVPHTPWINAFERDGTGRIKDKRYWGVVIGPGESHPEMPGFVMPLTFPNAHTKTGYIVTKYWQEASFVNSGINAPIIRFAEVLLNYAEALNEVGRSSEAMEQVNLIRERAGLDDLNVNLDKDDVLDAVFYERRMEFIWEPAGAFSDQNRRGRFMAFIKANRADYDRIQVETKPWLNQQPILIPIPQQAYDRNKSLTQNPGYPPFQ
ncbi:MAG: RagB/SusD family nutrient uptake outer membrane protein [Pedobacter sp.]|nr:MAG: RagB/SusD family nutrient uptake outer membrane protein [Pedobacter sp.]